MQKIPKQRESGHSQLIIQKGASARSIEIARNTLQMGMAIADIVKLTSLAHDEIEQLKN